MSGQMPKWMAVALGVVLGLGLGIGAFLLAGVAFGGDSDRAQCPTDPVMPFPDGEDGIGDPYLPEAGGTGYDVKHYDVNVRIDPATGEITGSAVVRLVTTMPLTEMHLDLVPTATAVSMSPVGSVVFQQNGTDLTVDVRRIDDCNAARSAGEELELTIEYTGRLDENDPVQESGVYRAGEEWLLAEEPQGAMIWFPANDHPRDPATYYISVTVPDGVEAISAGVLVDNWSIENGLQVWQWEISEPTVPYAVPLAIGQYQIDTSTEFVGGQEVQYLSAVTEVESSIRPMTTAQALAWLRTQHLVQAEYLVEVLGEYPADALGGIIPPQETDWGALETWGRPVYDPFVAQYQGLGEDMSYIVRHELAHFWFGNLVTLYEWDDIVINEGLADYFDGYLGPGTDRASADARFLQVYEDRSRTTSYWHLIISDPGPSMQTVFADQVYTRGGLMVHATRVLMGDDAFFSFLRNWISTPGPRSLEDWREMAQEYTTVDLGPAHRAWLDVGECPQATVENGFPQ